MGEWDGAGELEVEWSSAPYTAVEVCVRTAQGVTFYDITPAQSGTIVSDVPVVAFSLYKVTEVPTTTTTVPETTTTTAPTTTTTEGTTTTVPSSTTSPGPSTTAHVEGPGVPALADTGVDTGTWYVLAAAVLFIICGAWLAAAAARRTNG